jgi:hypothetical protein
MKKQAFYLFLALFSAQAIVLQAQNSEKPAPKFTLTIFLSQNGGAESEMPGQPIFREIRVVETNTSNELLQEAGCWDHKGIFHVSVVYNGESLEEKDTVARIKREATARRTPCAVPRSKAVINPGETGTRYIPLSIDYPMCKPGTYEIIVSRESDLEHPEKSVTVKSNTLTIEVPEPARFDL